jgi:hypothetical protein
MPMNWQEEFDAAMQAFGTRSTTFQIRAGTQVNTSTSIDANQHLWFIDWDGANSNCWQDAAQVITNQNAGSGDIDQVNLFHFIGTGFAWHGSIQEFVLFNIDQLANRSGIETNINDYYSIY